MIDVTQISPPPVPPANIPDRLRLWHPRFVACAVCTRPSAGFGFRNPHTRTHPRPAASQRRRWFCSKRCQALYAHHARKGLNMVDLTAGDQHAKLTP